MTRALRSAAVLALAALGFAAQAVPTLTLFNPDITLVRPASGQLTYDFLGTVTSTAGPLQYGSAGGLVVKADVFEFLPTDVYDDFVGTTSYTGRLFSVTVSADSSLGLYDHGFESPQSTFFVSDGPDFAELPFSVTIVAPQAVPEPPTIAALGLGAVAFLKRRKR